jgi:hypothetical protein
MTGIVQMMLAGANLRGQQVYTTAGTYSWVCPSGVTSICVLCVGGGAGGAGNGGGGGGGGLAYKNNISVTPGASYTIDIGGTYPSYTTSAFGITVQYGSYGTNTTGGAGGTATGGDVNYTGGAGAMGGGGAAGYTGNGGAGSGSVSPDTAGAGGGGIGLYGYSGSSVIPTGGSSGYSGTNASAAVGVAGSGGTNGATNYFAGTTAVGGAGGNYGGGGGGSKWSGGGAGGGQPGASAVRIIWGSGRSYPSNAGNL